MRCARHDLACGPDGACVLCRRAADAPATKTGAPWRLIAFGAAVVAIAAGGVAWQTQPAAAPIAITGEPTAEARAAGAPNVTVAAPPPSHPELFAEPTRGPAPAAAAHAAPAEDRGELSRAAEEAALRAAVRRVPITVYTTSWCGVCKHTKAWMRANDIPFTERDVEADESADRARRALTHERAVPTIEVDGEVFVGFDEDKLTLAINRAARRRM